MKTVPTFVVALDDRAQEVFGRDHISTGLTYQKQMGQMFWQGHICLIGRDSIFAQGATPAAAFDATMTAIELQSVENLAAVLGITEAA